MARFFALFVHSLVTTILVSAVLSATTVSAQGGLLDDLLTIPLENIDVVRAEHLVRFRTKSVEATSDNARLIVEVKTRQGVSIYTENLRFTWDEPFANPLPWTSNPQPVAQEDPYTGKMKDFVYSDTQFTISLESDPIDATKNLHVRFAACNLTICLLPTTFTLSPSSGAIAAPLELDATDSPFAATSTPLPATSSIATEAVLTPLPQNNQPFLGNLQAAIAAGSWLVLPLLLLGGLLMNLTPCIYPMIPVTIAVLGSFGKDASASRKRLLPWYYVAGIALSYSSMGLAAALTGALFGSLLQNNVVLIIIAIVMAGMGFVMLGIIDVSRIQNAASRLRTPTRVPEIGVFAMGALSALVAAPCAGPILASLLILVSQTNNPAYGFAMLFTFSLGFGIPYGFLGQFAGRGVRLPRLGRVLEGFKILFAGLMFALALYYIKRPLADAGVSLGLFERPSSTLVVGTFLLLVVGFIPQLSNRFPSLSLTIRTLAATALCLWGTLSVLFAFESSAPTNDWWFTDYQTAANKAKTEERVLVVDLWADWCAACKEMDVTIWSSPEVNSALNCGAVGAKIDFTRVDSAAALDLQKRKWEIPGLPIVAIFPAGSDLNGPPPTTLRGTITPAQLIQELKTLYSKTPNLTHCSENSLP